MKSSRPQPPARRARANALSALLLASAGSCAGPGESLPEPQRHQVESARAVSLDVHRTVERSLRLGDLAGKALVLTDHYGDVTITADAEGAPRCLARIEISAREDAVADALERTIGLVASDVDEGLRIQLNEPERDDELVFVSSASLEVFVPPGTELRVDLERGEFNGIGPFGRSRVETGQGDVRLRRVDGGVIARSNAGDVKLRQCTGGPVRASTDSGMVALLGSRTETARLESGRGRIVVNTAGGGTFDCFARQGPVRLVSVDANVTIEAEQAVTVEDFDGELLRITKGDGPLVLAGVRAADLSVEAESGRVELKHVATDRASLALETGDLVLSDVSGELEARTGSGQIDAVLLRGPSARLDTQRGAVQVRGVEGRIETRTGRGRTSLTRVAADVEVVSSEGPVELAGVLGALRIEGASGGVGVRARPGSDPARGWSVSCDQGDLVLRVPATLGFRLEARAEGGVIDSAFPIVVGAGTPQEPNALSGDVAGGGPTIELRAARGNLALREL